jgi:H+/gluconate symporter-like permease
MPVDGDGANTPYSVLYFKAVAWFRPEGNSCCVHTLVPPHTGKTAMSDAHNNHGWEASAWIGVVIVFAFIVVSGIWAGSNKSDMIASAPASQER